MEINNFYSSNTYIYLPTKKNLKVVLSIDNSTISKNAFKLYNPFSKKAILFKKVMNILYTKFNLFTKFILSEKRNQSEFIDYLEKKLNTKLIVSIYFATLKDKVVLQLQDKNAKIIGYLKFPLNNIGLKHIQNEINAIEILSKKDIVESAILVDEYEGNPFILLKEIDGTIGIVERINLNKILNKLENDQTYLLSEHPRVIELEERLTKHDFHKYIKIINDIKKRSTSNYKLVYEHGDFTPWNIVETNNKFVAFDYEYFLKDGLEYLDLIKYYYQVGKLLNNLNNHELISFIKKEININEIELLLKIFLIKEILRDTEENESFSYEENILELLEKK
jgi:branched-subunit amino acid transport protein AzlD